MAVCDRTCDPPCSYGCELGQKGLMVAPSATPSRMNNKPGAMANPAWERGIISEPRPDGSRMPILAPGTTRPLRVKEYARERRKIDAGIKKLKNS